MDDIASIIMSDEPTWFKNMKSVFGERIRPELLDAFQTLAQVFDESWYKREDGFAREVSSFYPDPFGVRHHPILGALQLIGRPFELELVEFARQIKLAESVNGWDGLRKNLRSRENYWSARNELRLFSKLNALGAMCYGDCTEQKPDWKIIIDGISIFIEVKTIFESDKNKSLHYFHTAAAKKFNELFAQHPLHLTFEVTAHFSELCNIFGQRHAQTRKKFLEKLGEKIVEQLAEKFRTEQLPIAVDWYGIGAKLERQQSGHNATLHGPIITSAPTLDRWINSVLKSAVEQTKDFKPCIISTSLSSAIDSDFTEIIPIVIELLWADERCAHIAAFHFESMYGPLFFKSPHLNNQESNVVEKIGAVLLSRNN